MMNADLLHPSPVMSILISWLVVSLSVYLTALALPGFHIKKTSSVLLIAALFGVLNFLLGWFFFTVFTVLTLGLAYLLAFITRVIVNAIILMIVDKATDHLKIDGFKWALAGAILMSLIGTGAQWLISSIGS